MRANNSLRATSVPNRHAAVWRERHGFTLVELVVVILIVGIIAAAAAPKAFDTSESAADETASESLNVIRDALELYRAENDTYPPTDDEAAFKAELDDYLRNNQFPNCPVGNKNNLVRVSTSGSPLNASGGEAWAYDRYTGEFIINHSSYSGL